MTQLATEATARDLGRLFARYYIAIGRILRETRHERANARRAGLALWEALPPEARFAFLEAHRGAIDAAFRHALCHDYRSEAHAALGFDDADFRHISADSPGNPDISPGVGGTSTSSGTVLVGPTISIVEKHASITIGAGPEVDYAHAADSVAAGGSLADAAKGAVKGAGAWIGVKIDC